MCCNVVGSVRAPEAYRLYSGHGHKERVILKCVVMLLVLVEQLKGTDCTVGMGIKKG